VEAYLLGDERLQEEKENTEMKLAGFQGMDASRVHVLGVNHEIEFWPVCRLSARDIYTGMI